MRPLLGWTAILLLPLTGARADDTSALEQARKGPHVCPAAQAVVGIEVLDDPATFSADGAKVEGAAPHVRRSSGLLIRCDGFVIAPSAVFGDPDHIASVRRALRIANRDPKWMRQVRVTLNPGTDRERRVVAPLPQRIVPGIGYAIVKLPGFHAPAARLRLPNGPQEEAPLMAYWTPWIESVRRFGPPQSAQVAVRSLPASVVPMGTATLTKALAPAAGGACLAAPDGTAVGIAPLGGGASCFTFAPFLLMSNCVVPSSGKLSPAPVGNVAKPADSVAGPPDDPAPKMISIPGGPVMLPRGVSVEQPDTEGAAWACVVPFEIDKYEVTNAEYLDFWNALPESARKDSDVREAYYPMGWAPRGEPFPATLANYPVLGVTYAGAEAYARSKGKRLPTPYEWCLAAFGPNGDTRLPSWAKDFIAACNGEWSHLSAQHVARMVPRAHADDNPATRRLSIMQGNIPWFYWEPVIGGVEESAWSKDLTMAAFLRVREQWKRPRNILAVGSRSFDTSPYGLADAVLNAAEMVLPYPSGRISRPNTVYVNVDWQSSAFGEQGALARYAPKGRWWGSLYDPWSNTNSPPFLSRLVGHTGKPQTLPGYYRYVVIESVFYEIADLIRPIDNWRVSYIKWQTAPWGFSGSRLVDDQVAHPSPIEQAISYPLWAGIPAWSEPEMGRAIALPADAMTERLGVDPFKSYFNWSSNRAEQWLAPGGFRCVRECSDVAASQAGTVGGK